MTATTVRVLVALDVPADQAQDIPDLLASVHARLIDEAGYLDPDDRPITPVRVVTAISDSLDPINAGTLGSAFEVGMEGAPEESLHWDECPVVSGTIEAEILACTCEG
jgi:hypothetical protein